MGNCKIVYNDTVLIDLSQDSVTPETLDEGVTAHDKDGNPIVGTRPVSGAPSEDLTAEIEAQSALIEEQASQIEELLTVLDEKAVGGNSGVLETCTLRVVGTIGESPDPSEPAPVENATIESVLYPYVKTTEDENGNLQHALAWKDDSVYDDYVEIEGVVVGHPLVISWIADVSETSILEPVNAECFGLSQTGVVGLFMCTKANDAAVITVVNGV